MNEKVHLVDQEGYSITGCPVTLCLTEGKYPIVTDDDLRVSCKNCLRIMRLYKEHIKKAKIRVKELGIRRVK